MAVPTVRGTLDLVRRIGGGLVKREHLKRNLRRWRGEALQRVGVEDFLAPRLAAPAMPLSADGQPPFLWRADHIESIKRAAADDPRRARAIAHVIAAAETALAGPLYSVIDKGLTPAGGDKQDYYTGGAYWWPTEGAIDGLPWTFRDGHMYPGRFTDDYDLTRLDHFAEAVKMLALGYRFTGRADYANKAAELVRAWFLDPERAMRPHLTYAQVTPGRNRITGTGIIETLRIANTIDAIGLLGSSGALTDSEVDGVREWVARYARWMRESENGRLERATNNNHGLSFDIQQMSYALFTGDIAMARAVAEDLPKRRVYSQITEAGALPEELRRKEAFFYVAYGIGFFFDAATVAENVGVDLWRYRSRGGSGIEPAFRDLIRYAQGGEAWTKGGGRVPGPELYALALRGAWAYGDPALAGIARRYEADLPLQPIDWTVAPYPAR